MVLHTVTPRLKADREVVETAVVQNPEALWQAAPVLRDDPKLLELYFEIRKREEFNSMTVKPLMNSSTLRAGSSDDDSSTLEAAYETLDLPVDEDSSTLETAYGTLDLAVAT